MEGIVRVLQAARHLSHAHLAPGEHYGLLVRHHFLSVTSSSVVSCPHSTADPERTSGPQVRLLTGVGRYDEMTYVFDLLHQNHRFEMLLRKKTDSDRRQVVVIDGEWDRGARQ